MTGFAHKSAHTVAFLAYLFFLCICVVGQTGTERGEWRTYGGDLGNTRYAPLSQINASNFNDLEVAWRFKTESLGPRPEYQFESTPLMVKNKLYSTAGSRRAVVALDAATGELLWMHSENEGVRGERAPRRLSGRGLAYWSDGKEERILYVTPGYRLIALNARTGTLVSGFGQGGAIDLKKNDDQEIDLESGDIGLQAAPIVAGNIIIIGAAHSAGNVPKIRKNVRGYVRGFDVKTGRRLWIFHTIPKPSEFGYQTWENDSASNTGNAGVWGQMSIDQELGLAYLPVEMPTGDYYGGYRPGAGLFGESIVAVDLRTGKLRWHYQLIHHGLWDMDIPCAPMLVDVPINGKIVKVLAQPTKQAFLYVFNRENGQPIWPMEERPVEKGNVPGEWYSPTQPIPSKPPAYDNQGVFPDSLIDFSPELHREALQLVSKYKIGGLFTPPVVSRTEGPFATLISPGSPGGSNWPGGSYDPETHMLYLFSQSTVSPLAVVPNTDKAVSEFAYVFGFVHADPRKTSGGLTVHGMPLLKPPYGRITAIDMTKGEIAWQIAHGETPDSIRNNPALKGLTIPRTGRPGMLGTLTTKTLVICGEGGVYTTPLGIRGAMLRAYDKATGKEVGTVYMPAPQTGSPMTYMLNGDQYIVLAIGGGNYSGELLAFRLPRKTAATTIGTASVSRASVSLPRMVTSRTVWDGVYTTDGANRGKQLYNDYCAACHGNSLAGGEMAPALIGSEFLDQWKGQSVATLFERIRSTMPLNNPGQLNRAVNADITAYILLMNQFPAGKTELTADDQSLGHILIDQGNSRHN